MCQLLLVAGFETTVNLISNAVLALQRTPGAWEALVADPGLAALAVEETLRFDPPVQRTIRAAFDDTELGGHPIPKSTWVVGLIGGANRDPSAFEAPAEFRDRPVRRPGDARAPRVLRRRPLLHRRPARPAGGHRRPAGAGRAAPRPAARRRADDAVSATVRGPESLLVAAG